MPVVLIVLALVILYIAQRIIYKHKWQNNLNVDLHFSVSEATEGDTCALIEQIENRKRLPLASLQVKFSIDRKLEFLQTENTSVTDRNYRNDVFCIMGGERVTRTLPFICRRRGYYRVDESDIISSDLFFSTKLANALPQNASLYVYPGPVDTRSFENAFKQLMGTVLTRRYTYEDPFEFIGIRPYEQRDSMRDVNWMASARTGQLMVNQHGHTSSPQVIVLLDLHSDTNWLYEGLCEESIRITAAYVRECAIQGIPVGLITNGVDCLTGEPSNMAVGAGADHALLATRNLARIDIHTHAADLTPTLRELAAQADADRSIYVLISHSRSTSLLNSYGSLCAISPGSQWVALVHPDMPYDAKACPSAIPTRWEVPYDA